MSSFRNVSTRSVRALATMESVGSLRSARKSVPKEYRSVVCSSSIRIELIADVTKKGVIASPPDKPMKYRLKFSKGKMEFKAIVAPAGFVFVPGEMVREAFLITKTEAGTVFVD